MENIAPGRPRPLRMLRFAGVFLAAALVVVVVTVG